MLHYSSVPGYAPIHADEYMHIYIWVRFQHVRAHMHVFHQYICIPRTMSIPSMPSALVHAHPYDNTGKDRKNDTHVTKT